MLIKPSLWLYVISLYMNGSDIECVLKHKIQILLVVKKI